MTSASSLSYSLHILSVCLVGVGDSVLEMFASGVGPGSDIGDFMLECKR